MTIAEKIRAHEARAREERAAALAAHCREARRAHLALAREHQRAAERERARLAASAAAMQP
jgi:hypothetical protein